MCGGIHTLYTARREALYVAVTKRIPWGRKRLEVDYDKISVMLAYEIDLYEILRAIGCITMAMATMMLMTGKLSQWASNCQWPGWYQRKFSLFLGVFMIFYFLCRW